MSLHFDRAVPYTGRYQYLVRHGESEANAGQLTENPATVRLTKIGRLQAQVAALALCAMDIEARLFISSPYTRANEGALLAKELFPDARIENRWPIREFTYLHFGDKPTDNEHRRPQREAYWHEANPRRLTDINDDLCESYGTFTRRVGMVAIALSAQDETVVLFGHEQFFNQLRFQQTPQGSLSAQSNLAYPGPQHMRNFYEFLHENRIPNGGIIRLDQIRNTSALVFTPPTDEAVLSTIVQDSHAGIVNKRILFSERYAA